MFYFLLAMPGCEGAGALPNLSADTSNVRGALFALPPPPPLDIHDSNAAEKWKEFEQAWKNYSINCHEVASGTRSHTSCNIAFRSRS